MISKKGGYSYQEGLGPSPWGNNKTQPNGKTNPGIERAKRMAHADLKGLRRVMHHQTQKKREHLLAGVIRTARV